MCPVLIAERELIIEREYWLMEKRRKMIRLRVGNDQRDSGDMQEILRSSSGELVQKSVYIKGDIVLTGSRR